VCSIISSSAIARTAARCAKVALGKQIHIKPDRRRRRDVTRDQTIVQGLESCNRRAAAEANQPACLTVMRRGRKRTHGLILIKFVAERRTIRKQWPRRSGTLSAR
jgi:hypothetical protein